MADQNIEITIKDSTSSGGGSGTPVGGSSTAKTSATPADIAKIFGKSILSGHGIMGALKDVGKISAGVAIGMSIFSAIGKGISFIVNLFRKSRIFSSFFNAFLDILMSFIDLLMVPLIPFLTSVLNMLMDWLQAYQEGGWSGLIDAIWEDIATAISTVFTWDNIKTLFDKFKEALTWENIKTLIEGVALLTLFGGLITAVTLLALLGPLITGITLLELFTPLITGVSLSTLFSKFITGASISTILSPAIKALSTITLAATTAIVTGAISSKLAAEGNEGAAGLTGAAAGAGTVGAIATGSAAVAGVAGVAGLATLPLLDLSSNNPNISPNSYRSWLQKFFFSSSQIKGGYGVVGEFIDKIMQEGWKIPIPLGWQGYTGNDVLWRAGNLPSAWFDINKTWDPNTPNAYRLGTNYIPEDMMAFLHKGERVVPAVQNTFNQNFNYNGSESAFLAGKTMANSFNDNVRTILMRR